MADEFKKFIGENGIQHIKSAPYHPATNGLAERMVQTFKYSLKAAKANRFTVQKKLDQFLMSYRNAAHATTNRPPAELFYGRRLTSRLDLLKPDVRCTIINTQTQHGKYHGGKIREFNVGDTVLVHNYRGKDKWTRGEVVSRRGMSYDVEVAPGVRWRRHIEQVTSCQTSTTDPEDVIIPESCPVVPEDTPNTVPVDPTVQRESILPDTSSDETATAEIPGDNFSATETEQDQSTTPSSSNATPITSENNSYTTERRYPLRKRTPRQFFVAGQ